MDEPSDPNPTQTPPPLTDAWKAELDRRLAAHHADPSAALTWEEVRAALRARRAPEGPARG